MDSIMNNNNENFINNDSFNSLNLEPLEKISLESNYIEENINSFKLIRKRNYFEAVESYKNCLNIAQKLKDKYKIKDSLCNYAICQFYNGEIKESLQTLETSYNQIDINCDVNNINEIRIEELNIKVMCNLLIIYLFLNKLNEANNVFNSVLKLIKNYEDNVEIQNKFLKNILYIFFRLDSLTNISDFFNHKIVLTNKPDSEEHKKVIKKIIDAFHAYLKNNNINLWIQVLSEEIENLKILKDYNGIIFAVFNLESSNYINSVKNKDEKGMLKAINKFSSLTKALVGEKNFDEKSINNLLNVIKEKMEIVLNIYKTLYSLENEINNKIKKKSLNDNLNISQNSNMFLNNGNNLVNKTNLNNSFFLNFLFKISLNNINKNIKDEKLKNQIKKQITITQNLINKKEIDLSNLKLNFISPEIMKSLELLFNNLFIIYNKSYIRKYLNKFKKNTDRKIKDQNNKKLNKFFLNYYTNLYEGDLITKINQNSQGSKNHYYRIDFDTDTIQIFQKKQSNKIDKSYKFSEIQKILYGCKSQNLIKKIKKIPNNDQPWIYLSFIFPNSNSIDLCIGETKIKKWFYGLNYFLNNTKKKYKIMSNSKFIIDRIKMKLINMLTTLSEDGYISELQTKYQIKSINDSYNGNVNNISFIKLMKIYKKVGKQ
jgi:hypothetical protein